MASCWVAMLGLNSDNYQTFLKEWFGRNWVYHLRPLILSIKLAEFYSLEESRESVKAVWLAAIHERQRRCGRRYADETGSCERKQCQK
jgi:hypothetical protein